MLALNAPSRRAAAALGAIVAAITAGHTAAAGDGRAPVIGDSAPPLATETLDGTPLPDGSTAGRITIVDFFATWCRPCHRALADLAAIRGDLGPRVQVLLVDVQEDPTRVRRFFDAAAPGAPLPEGARILLDRTGEMARRWGQDRFPTTFLVDEKGVIRHINRGWGSGYRERLSRWLRAMLAGAGRVRTPSTVP